MLCPEGGVAPGRVRGGQDSQHGTLESCAFGKICLNVQQKTKEREDEGLLRPSLDRAVGKGS